MVDINPVLQQLPTYPAEALYAKRAELVARGLEVFDFSVGDPIEPTDERIRAAFAAGMPEVTRYPTVRGLPELRQAIAAWLARRFGVQLDPDRELLPTQGSKEAIFHLPLAFCDPARRPRILFGVPGYPAYERGALFCGAVPWPVELRAENDYLLEPWALDPALIAQTGTIWINYPHNPTAALADEAYLRRLVAFCRERAILLAADECYVDMYLGEARPPSVLQLAREGVLAFHSLSKRSGMTGYRSGFVAGDPALIAVLAEMRGNPGVAPLIPTQRAAVVAWQDEEHARARREIFRAKRDLFVRFFAQAGIAHAPCEATLYLWVRAPETAALRGGAAATAYAERLADRGILVSPAPHSGVDQPFFRVALVPPIDDCARAIAVWERMLADDR